MRIEGVRRDQYYDIWTLAERARMPIEQIRQLVERGQIDSHITGGEPYINGKDFLEWAEKQKGEQRHYE
ncbi:hypothetical protein [Effusibacillus pohliae]|uniref:hypothetical protein n=1 Tax=Effusibacillus pohliae TaxID=232270 RepID=UPI00036F38E5|nr:hypothetical protein [Effusibacillus pohliae]